jgi:Holliday junction resolvase
MVLNNRVGVEDAATRGRRFEAEVAKFLRAVGFEVTANAGTARPRQTDLFAKGDDVAILIEAKDQKRNVDIGDIDSLRARLNRTSSDIVGAVFTTSRLTKRAIEAIEMDRRREVLAFVKEEIDQLRRGNQNLRTLMERKREELRVHGKAWFGLAGQSEYVAVKLPVGSIEFMTDGKANSYFESRSDLSGAIYSLQVPHTGWGAAGGE